MSNNTQETTLTKSGETSCVCWLSAGLFALASALGNIHPLFEFFAMCFFIFFGVFCGIGYSLIVLKEHPIKIEETDMQKD